MARHLLAATAAAALLTAGGAALAMGGGGGGGSGGGGGMGSSMPSASAPQYDASAEYARGMADFQAAKYKDAARDFEHVTEAAPQTATGWYMLGQARGGEGDTKGAAKAYEKAVKIDPKPVGPRRDWAVALVKLNQKDKAQKTLDQLKSEEAACGDACADAADLKAAVAAVEAAMGPAGTAPASPAAMLSRPGGLMFEGQAGDVAYVAAVSLINEHRWSEALASLDKAEAAFGPHPDILTYEGYVWRKLGQPQKAETYYKAALAAAPAHRGAAEYYGELKVMRGDMAGARTLLARLDSECAFGCAEAEELRAWIALGRDPAS